MPSSASSLPDRTRLLEACHKKTIEVRWGETRCAFDLPFTGFSSFGIDLGTARLLRGIDLAKPRWKRALDLGCGYGPIASHLVATGIADAVVGIDRDILAVEYSRRNALKNGLAQAEFVGGLAYEDVPPGAYSAIVSNLPAKAGESVQRMLLLEASRRLEPGGEVWIVAVSPLEARIDGMLAIEHVTLLSKTNYNGHVVYRYAFRAPVPGPDQPYHRGRAAFEWRGIGYELDAFAGLPEFDTRSYDTDLLLRATAEGFKGRSLRTVVVCDPGQGHLAVLLPALLKRIGELVLVSRDALALKAAASNARPRLAGTGLRVFHSVAYREEAMGLEVDLILAALDKKEGIEVSALKIAQACRAGPRAVLLAACGTALRSRLAAQLRSLGINATTATEHHGRYVLRCAGA